LLTTSFGPIDEAHSVAIDSRGRIVAAGRDGRRHFAIARYTPEGTLDPSFSADGKQTTSFGDYATASSLAVDSRDRIVVAGRTRTSSGDRDFALARYLPSGSLDPSFSGNGKAVPNAGGMEGATSVAIDARGRIVAVGHRGAGYRSRHFAVVRFRPNGVLDRSFSHDGRRRTSLGDYVSASSVAIDARNRIVVAGTTADRRGEKNFAVFRYRPDGGLDRSFSRDGKRTTNFGGYDAANSVTIDARGRIVAAGFASGYRSNGSGYDFALVRYRRSGKLDDSFSGNGKLTRSFGADNLSDALSVAIDSQNRIVAAGLAQSQAQNQDFALTRETPNGSPDDSFSGDARLRTDFGGYDRAYSVAIDSEGRIVAAGTFQDFSGGQDFALARYLG
jgi:uncharacterized delta-60 repeat protein